MSCSNTHAMQSNTCDVGPKLTACGLRVSKSEPNTTKLTAQALTAPRLMSTPYNLAAGV